LTSLDAAARILLQRKRSWNGAMIRWTVMIDNRDVGQLANGGTLDVPIGAGPHRVHLTAGMKGPWKSKPLDVTIKPGDVLRLTCGINPLGRLVIEDAHGSGAGVEAGPSRGTVVDPGDQADHSPIVAVDVVEAARRELALGDETRVIDNSRSSSPTVRTMRLTKEWTKSYAIDMESAMTVTGSVALSALAGLKAEAERTLTKHYSTSVEDRRSFEEEVTLTIGAGIRSEIVFSWKEIRQSGTLVLRSADTAVEIPFEVVVGVTFDQRQVDASTAP
jgi:hypothetical protein